MYAARRIHVVKGGHKSKSEGTATPRYWLMKSEPTAFSIQDLQKAPGRTTCWDGVRNYQARNFMRAMHVGDGIFFYHSNADPPAIVGIAEVVREAYPDHSAFDRHDVHFDPKSTPEKPLWDMVDIRLVRIFPHPIPLEQLRCDTDLKHMELLRKGSRLSVQPVRPEEWMRILSMAEEENR
jgi:predicted RNA-binding protein with PUA-like domain